MENLTNEELVESYQDGNDYAATILWERNKGLVHKYINKHKVSNYTDEEDKMSACHVAFIKSLKLYKKEKGYKFLTYFGHAMNKLIMQESWDNGKERKSVRTRKALVYYHDTISGNGVKFLERSKELTCQDEYFKNKEDIVNEDLKKALEFAKSKINEEYKEHLYLIYSGQLNPGDVAVMLNKSPQSVNAQLRLFEKNALEHFNNLKKRNEIINMLSRYVGLDIIDELKVEFENDLIKSGLNKNLKVSSINKTLELLDIDYEVVVKIERIYIGRKTTSKSHWYVVKKLIKM